ncbi:MAG: hypothetical protein J5873_00070 [Bacteroidales bacterium]|nr:hypothetical protein [Bacteroidales bacterium]
MDDYRTPSDENLKYRKWSNIFLILSIVLALLLILSLIRTRSTKTEWKESVSQQVSLQSELDSILFAYDQIKNEYGELNAQLTEKDSAIMAQAEEIQKLIQSQSDYRRVKKKLELLQNQGKEYVRLLDSLYAANETLTIENRKIKSEYSKLNAEHQQMALVQDSLNERIRTASHLKAYDIAVQGIVMKSGGKKEEATNRSKRVEKFKITFTLGENAIAKPGNTNLYCRLSIPSGKVLALGKGDAYTFVNEGKVLQYTVKSTVLYENKAQNVVMYWNLRDGDAAVPGTYIAQLFTEDEYIGEASVTLR